MSYVSDELYKYLRGRMTDFLKINAVELLPHLPCLTQMDQEKIRAEAKYEGNEAAIPILLDSVRRRQNWERQLINALRNKEYNDLAGILEQKLESLAPRRNVSPSVASHPNHSAVDSSTIVVVPFQSAPFDVSPPRHPSSSVTVADNSQFPTTAFRSADDLLTLSPSNQTNLRPSAGIPAAEHPASKPTTQPSAGPPATRPSAGPPATRPSAGPPATRPSAGPPATRPSAGPPATRPSAGPPATRPSAGPPATRPSAGPPATRPSAGPPATRPSAGPPATRPSAGPPTTQPSASVHAVSASGPAAFSTTSTASSSSVSSTSSTFTSQHHSLEFKIPIQETGKSMDREENKDEKLPVQEKMGTFDDSKSNDSFQSPRNQTINSDQSSTGEKRNTNEIFTANTDQARREIKNNQALADDSATCNQVHTHRPQLNDNDFESIGKPGMLQGNVQNKQSETQAESFCKITSADLQLSENPVDNSSNENNSNRAMPNANLNPRDMSKEANFLNLGDCSSQGANVSCDYDDKNSIKEQKIQALQGYQNDQLQQSFYDVHSPLNIQLNFDAQKKIDEGVDSDQKHTLNQNKNIEYDCRAFQTHNIEIAKSGHDGADSEVECMKNVQTNNSTDSISNSEQLSSSCTECSFRHLLISGDSVSEPSAHVEHNSQNANRLNNDPLLPACLPIGTQALGQISNMDGLQENAQIGTTECAGKQECMGIQKCENWFTETKSNNKSNQGVNVSKRERSSYSCANELTQSTCDANPTVYNEDVKEYSGYIYQEPDSEVEAGNDCEFEAAILEDAKWHDFGNSSIHAFSPDCVSLISRKEPQPKKPVKPNADITQSNYLFATISVLVLSVVAVCVWKYCHK
ncbi:microtubule-associated protein RP/EB family member 1 isoform X2 [Stegostoma tigrinum]|uniref:microtubule-associated protein RP/EB family member 1 isoform X2 n=1 Tax=Stegostoma tigrinum TaxID=3053191 RepID=UPI0028701EEE|nr:microtubule-associated protein RP/EB family member 1 isoform X2 [Stegostoma tigrinum]